jgi:hypothetical protein
MHRILFLPDIRPAGNPVNPKAGYRISGRMLDLTTIFLVKYQVILIKRTSTTIDFCKQGMI